MTMEHTDRLAAMLDRMRSGEVVKAYQLAAVGGVSLRSVYRSIAILRGQGHRIAGEAGVGYLLRDKYDAGRQDVPELRQEVDGGGDAAAY